MGITNIELKYTDEDFQSLVTYKLFNQHIRPMLLEKNPKLVMYKMVSVIGAKWREFIELRETKEKEQSETTVVTKPDEDDTQKSEAESTTSSKPASNEATKAADTDEVVTEKAAVTDETEEIATGRGARGRRANKKRDYAESEEPVVSVAKVTKQADIEEEDVTSRRSLRRGASTAKGSSKSYVEEENIVASVEETQSAKGTKNKAATPAGKSAKRRKKGRDVSFFIKKYK